MGHPCDRCSQWRGDSMWKGNPCALNYEPGECPTPDLTGDAVRCLEMICEYAYGHGLHEVGYDPIQTVVSDIAALRARCEALEEDSKSLASERAEMFTKLQVAEKERDALKTAAKCSEPFCDRLIVERDEWKARAEKAEKALEDAREQAESDELYCGCEHHRPGATAQALWDEDGCCQVCGVDVDPWTQRALVAEAKLARVREIATKYSEESWDHGFKAVAGLVLSTILDEEPT